MEQKRKLKSMKAILLATSLVLSNPVTSYAKTPALATEEGTLKDKLSEWGSKFFDWAEKADGKINEEVVDPAKEKVSEIELYKQESLWLITDMPSVSPEKERNYFFVNKNIPNFKWTYYYDKYGNEVSEDSPELAKMEIRKMYVSLTNPEIVFKIEEWFDYETFTFTINYTDFDKALPYDENTNAKYGRFANIGDVLPEEYLKEKYSTEDLKELLELINDPTYELSFTDANLSLKK